MSKISGLVLMLCMCAPLTAVDAIAQLDPGSQDNFQQRNRWTFEKQNEKAVVRLNAKMTSYCSVPLLKDLPNDGVIMLSLTVSGKAKAGTFHAGVGAWGSPTKQILADNDAVQQIELGFPVSYAKRHVKDGKISMMFVNQDSNKSPAIQGISFYVPSKDKLLATYRDYVANNTQAAIKASQSAAFKFVGVYDDALPIKASTVDEKRGFIPFVRNYMMPVYKKTVPNQKERTAALTMRMAKNESEPVQVAITSLQDISQVSLNIAKTLPKGLQASVYWVENVPLRTKGGTSSKNWHTAPNRLWPQDLYPAPALKKHESRSWYVIVKSDVSAGKKVTLPLMLNCDGQDKHQFDLEIEVLPFSLPKATNAAFGYYLPDKMSEKDIKKMAMSGCNSASAWPTFMPFKNGQLDFEEWDAYFALLKKYKMDHSFLWYVGTKKQGFTLLNKIKSKTVLIEMLKVINSRVKSGQYPRNFYITLDEAVQNKGAFKSLKELAALMREHCPDLKPFGVSLNRYNYTTQHDGFIDMLSCNGSFEQNEQWCKQRDMKMYSYTSFNARMNVGILRYNAGFNPWRYHAHGTFAWAYNWANGNPFNDMDSWGSDWIMVFPNWLGDPISSPGWCGWTEGIDDRRYLELLEERVQAGQADAALLNKLRAFLAADYHAEETVVGDSEFAAIINDSEKLIKARSMIIDALMK